MEPKILYKFATRSRPEKFLDAIDNIQLYARHTNYEILVTADIDDPTMYNNAMWGTLSDNDQVRIYYGHSKTKIEAINADMNLSGAFDILCVHSDDMRFTVDGFDLLILAAMEGHNGLLHFPDQYAGAKLCTYPMMTREYYDLDGFIYHPSFVSVYADNYQQDLAKRRGMYKYEPTKILEHRHPSAGWGKPDAQYKRTEAPGNYLKDKLTYNKLRAEL